MYSVLGCRAYTRERIEEGKIDCENEACIGVGGSGIQP